MEILVVLRDKDKSQTEKIKQIFSEINSKINQINQNQLNNLKVKFAWKNKLKKEQFKNKNLIITIGGDGTFLSASHFVENQLIIGVNDNPNRSEGFLTSININELKSKIIKILQKKFFVKEYQRAKIEICKEKQCPLTELALNEVYIGNKNPHHPSRYILKNNNKEEIQMSSGVLITTGTGSTAWYKAMGGWPFNKSKKQLRFRIREPFSGRLHKTKIKKGKIKNNKQISITCKMNHGIIAIDSIRVYKISLDETVTIKLGNPLRVIQ